MKTLALFVCLSLSGCAVVQNTQSELHKEMIGFKTNWDHYVLKKEVTFE